MRDSETWEGDQKILEISGMTIKRSWQTIIASLDMSIKAGDRLYLAGENGAGKSSCLEAILGLLVSDCKVQKWMGMPGSPAACNAFSTGDAVYIPQKENLFSALTLRDNITIGASISVPDIKNVFQYIIEQFPEMCVALDRKPAQSSAGQRQLAACMRIFMHRPKLLVMDEISAGLSADVARRLFASIDKAIASSSCIVFTDQSPDFFKSWTIREARIHKKEVRSQF